jgi:hypothetical protein
VKGRDLLQKADAAMAAKRNADLADLVDGARERLRPTLPPCWKCGAKHWPVEPCDHGGWPVMEAIDKKEVS